MNFALPRLTQFVAGRPVLTCVVRGKPDRGHEAGRRRSNPKAQRRHNDLRHHAAIVHASQQRLYVDCLLPDIGRDPGAERNTTISSRDSESKVAESHVRGGFRLNSGEKHIDGLIKQTLPQR
jgi:hypothetical protein